MGVHRTKLQAFAILGLAALCLGGCSHIRVKLGTRIRIDQLPIQSIAVRMDGGPEVPINENGHLVVTLTQPDGTVLVTEGAGHGKVLWGDLNVTTSFGRVRNGTFRFPDDPLQTEGSVAHLTVTVPSHPGLQAEVDARPRFNVRYTAFYSGSDGLSGSDGSNGSDGSSGSAGSLDPDHPSAGGNGGNGTDGGDGSNGHDGDNGPEVIVQLAVRPGPHPMLQAAVGPRGSRARLFLIDVEGGGFLDVNSRGGSGGSGGRGGRGGRGGSGGIGSPNGSDGSSGHDGHDGSRGSDGREGSVTVLYDPAAKPYLTAVEANNVTFAEQPIPPLW